MLKKVTEAINRFKMLENIKHITVALSGGADSMALLYALFDLKNDLNLQKLTAAHFNHQIRGEEALRDQTFVTEQCQKLGIELIVGSADVPEYARQRGISIELAARKLRYEFFDSLDTELVATAHTASDNIETIILNLTRGTALSGLCGIPVKRDKFIRPLILCTREDIECYCNQKGIEFVTDSTNLCDDYTRNKIRHNVVPTLKQINQSVENSALRMTSSLREDEHFINSVAKKEYNSLICESGLRIENFSSLHPAVAKRVIARYCAKFKIELDNFHINQIYAICLSGGKISLSNKQAAYTENGILKIGDAKQQIKNVEFSVSIEQKDNDLFENNKKVHNLLLKNILDCDKIVGQLVLRSRQSGDTVRLKNKNCTKTLKKLFCEYKIPLEERENLPVLTDDLGVVWIHKIGVAERVAVDRTTKQIYTINIK